MTPAQCKAARGLLKWTTRELARAAQVSQATLVHFEGSQRNTNPRTVRALQETLEAAGVEFVSPGTVDQAVPVSTTLSDGSVVRLRDATS